MNLMMFEMVIENCCHLFALTSLTILDVLWQGLNESCDCENQINYEVPSYHYHYLIGHFDAILKHLMICCETEKNFS